MQPGRDSGGVPTAQEATGGKEICSKQAGRSLVVWFWLEDRVTGKDKALGRLVKLVSLQQ